MRERIRQAFTITVLVGLIGLVTPTAAVAATLIVDDDLACPGATFTTIQDAVNAASPGDTIEVCAGTYPEAAVGPLTINKSLTVLGAQDGVDARGPRGAESIIADIQGTSVAASSVVIDGFTVQNSSVAAFTGYGIWMNPGTTGTRILNNIIQNNIAGVGLANGGSVQAVIRHNLFHNNTLPGGASGSGIYTDEFVGGPIVRNVLIEENAFRQHSGFGGAINISNNAFPAGGVFGLDVNSNEFDDNSRAFVLFNTHDSTFDDNTVTDSTYVGSADVRLFDGNSNLLFTNNDLRNGPGHAVRFSDLGLGGPSSNVDFHFNNFEVYALTGMTVDSAAHTGTVDAECNWWNAATGPMNPSNPGGTGEEVVGDADFTPWLIAPAPNGPCVGLPNTPGKVTGGGQIQGDPVFSPLGDLLSVPAIVPSLAGGAAQSTFGLVATCCPASGNLEYNDHAMDVRIKATSISGLSISSPGVSCPAVPGSRHATITGTAQVIRPTGTTTESFTVEVDDCGEPGTTDTFGIETTTYANGPRTLIGGNIQIHR
jgi:hypothetical protein